MNHAVFTKVAGLYHAITSSPICAPLLKNLNKVHFGILVCLFANHFKSCVLLLGQQNTNYVVLLCISFFVSFTQTLTRLRTMQTT